jgi:hypothetical protein
MTAPLNKTPQPPLYPERALRNLELERKRDAEERITGWTVIWTLFAFKMFTVGLIWYVARDSQDAGAEADSLLVATTWYWLTIPAVALSGFVGYRLRLRRTRKRAAELRRAEFMQSHRDAESGTMNVALTEDEKARLRALGIRREGKNQFGVD